MHKLLLLHNSTQKVRLTNGKTGVILKEKEMLMEEKFVITEITRVIMVGKDEYTEAKTSFSPHLESNEIVFIKELS